jgi:hypothetical protein
MKNFWVIIFSRFNTVLKDDFSAMAVIAYFLSLNIFTIIGYYRHFFLHSTLSEVPLFYSLIIMLLSGIFTQAVIFKKIKQDLHLQNKKQALIAKETKGTWITLVYSLTSFVLMLGAV